MTKDTGDLTQFHAVACREYTLPREEPASQPRRWIRGNTKIGPVLEVTTSYWHGKHGVEIRIISLSRDNTVSWVRISHGSNKCVMNLNNNETEIPEDQLEEYALKLNAKDFACRSKQKQNHKEENLPALHQESFPLKEGIGLILNHGIFFLCVRSFEESDSSSSSFTESTSRRRRSGSFLQNEGKSS